MQLDSENSLLIIELLKKLSRENNVASVVIIHQPSAKVFRKFDNLLLLAKGHPVYTGPLEELSEFYERNYDEAMPPDYYLADDLIRKAIAHQTQRSTDHWAGPLQASSVHSEREEEICLDTSMISEENDNPRPNDESELSFGNFPMKKETEIPRASDESIMSFEDSSRAKYFPESSNLSVGTNMATKEDEIRLKSISSAVIDLDNGGKILTKEKESKESKDVDFLAKKMQESST